MLKNRIIPVLLIKDGNLVKGVGFDSWRTVGHPLQAAKIHEMRGVDELIILDIGATPNNTPINIQLVEEISRDCFMPLTVGGGVRTLDDIGMLLRAGADKVCIGTMAVRNFDLIWEAAQKFGSQCIAASVDVSSGGLLTIGCGQNETMFLPEGWCGFFEHLGAGEILLNRHKCLCLLIRLYYYPVASFGFNRCYVTDHRCFFYYVRFFKLVTGSPFRRTLRG